MADVSASRIVGGNSAYGRSQSDFYPPPPDVTVALMRFLNLPRTTSVWEPATGEGDMAGVLQTYFETVYATDIIFRRRKSALRNTRRSSVCLLVRRKSGDCI